MTRHKDGRKQGEKPAKRDAWHPARPSDCQSPPKPLAKMRCGRDGMVDISDLKSVGLCAVGVQVPPPAPNKHIICFFINDLIGCRRILPTLLSTFFVARPTRAHCMFSRARARGCLLGRNPPASITGLSARKIAIVVLEREPAQNGINVGRQQTIAQRLSLGIILRAAVTAPAVPRDDRSYVVSVASATRGLLWDQ